MEEDPVTDAVKMVNDLECGRLEAAKLEFGGI
jgi:hypothetical protein